MTKSIAFYNNKGGVGKTTSVINIAYQLAAENRILVVDLDGQANCSRFFVDEPKAGLEQALTLSMVSPEIALCPTRYPNIDVITATQNLNDIVSDFCALPEKRRRENSSRIFSFSTKYDYILADFPPALNQVTESVISACDYVFVPIELGTFAIQGIPTVTDLIADCGAKFGGCFVNKFDKDNPADNELFELLKTRLGTKALDGFIPYSRVVKNSVSYKMTAQEYMGWTYAAECCAKLAREIAERCAE